MWQKKLCRTWLLLIITCIFIPVVGCSKTPTLGLFLLFSGKASLVFMQKTHTENFLLDIPIDELGHHISSVEYRTIFKNLLMIFLFPIDDVYPFYRKVCLDTFGKHTLHCRELLGFKYQHDFVRNAIFYIFRWTWVSLKKKRVWIFWPTHRWEAIMCGFDSVFPNSVNYDWRFYYGTNITQSRFK